MLKTRVTDILGIDVPIVLAPMGRWAEASLATAVCKAGGLGTIGAWAHAGIDPPEVRRQIALIRQQTDRPFGAGFVSHLLADQHAHLEAALEERVPVILLSFGDPSAWIPVAHAGGAKVICQVQSFDLAQKAVEAGTDILCVQGREAGGHTGGANLLPLLVQCLEAFPETPILAAGGISNGRALASVLAAGAEGAWIGTALVASHDAAWTSADLRAAIIASDGHDTIRSPVVDLVRSLAFSRPGWPDGVVLRHRRNALTDRWDGREHELAADKHALEDCATRLASGAPDSAVHIYGPGAAQVRAVKTAKDTIDTLLSDARACLAHAAF